MSAVLDWLRAQTRVADGAVATALRAGGWPQRKPAELACVEQPERVRRLAASYASAGAELISTNTFSANALAAGNWSEPGDLRAINEAAGKIARAVADEVGGRVAGIIGPSWKLLAIKEVEPGTLQRVFADQARILADAGADLLVLETFSELEETKRAVAGASEAGVPVVACMSFDSGPQRTATRAGIEAGDAADALMTAGVAGVGANCGAGAAHILPAAVALRAHCDGIVWIKPSLGPPDLDGERLVYKQTADEFCQPVPQLLDVGVNAIGGCCGAGPEHIKRLAAIVDHHRKHPHTHVE